MKKTFSLQAAGKDAGRVLDAIKHEVRKYVRRERNKPLPKDFDRWSFACRVGGEAATAVAVPLKEVSRAIDEVAQTEVAGVYVEVVAVPAYGSQPGGEAS